MFVHVLLHFLAWSLYFHEFGHVSLRCWFKLDLFFVVGALFLLRLGISWDPWRVITRQMWWELLICWVLQRESVQGSFSLVLVRFMVILLSIHRRRRIGDMLIQSVSVIICFWLCCFDCIDWYWLVAYLIRCKKLLWRRKTNSRNISYGLSSRCWCWGNRNAFCFLISWHVCTIWFRLSLDIISWIWSCVIIDLLNSHPLLG